MSKKIFIIISAVLTLFLLSLLGYYFLIKDNTGSTGGIVSGFKSFFPFGGDDPETLATTTEMTDNDNQPIGDQSFGQKLRKISDLPVSGAGTLDVKAGTIIRYIEKATGHIYEVEMFSPNRNRISNTTIPRAYDAVWGNKNNSLMARYLKDDDQTVDTYSLTLTATSTATENTIAGIIFTDNITDVSVYGSSVFFLVKNPDSSSGFISNFDGSKKKQVWNSDIKELSSQYIDEKTIALTTRPAQNVPGFLYLVNTTNGGVKKALGDISGLSANISPDSSKIIYLEQVEDAYTTVYDLKTKIYTPTTPVTFPEKCAWSKKDKDIVYCAVPKEVIDGSSLTSWYKGEISYTDDIWKFDTKNNTSSRIEGLSEEGIGKIDLIKPILSENEQYLIFINKIDNSLWSLDLTK